MHHLVPLKSPLHVYKIISIVSPNKWLYKLPLSFCSEVRAAEIIPSYTKEEKLLFVFKQPNGLYMGDLWFPKRD